MVSSEKEHDRLNGWKAIAKKTGYSEKWLQELEKSGVIRVKRDPHKKKSNVWACEDEIISAIDAYLSSRREPKPPPEDKKKSLRLIALISFPLVLSSLVWKLNQPDRFPAASEETSAVEEAPPFIHDFAMIVDQEGIMVRIIARDRTGRRTKVFFEPDSPIDLEQTKEYSMFNFSRNITLFRPAGGKEPVIFETLDDIPKLHTFTSTRVLDMPPLEVNSKSGYGFDLLGASFCHRMGDYWAVIAYSRDSFPGCLVLFDDQLQEVGRLYHPGRIRGLGYHDGNVYLFAWLNAREHETEPETGIARYRPALFSFELDRVLGDCYQVKPYSHRTIPSEHRRSYYELEGPKPLIPETYIAFAPTSREEVYFHIQGERFLVHLGIDPENMVTSRFTPDLRLIDTWVQDRSFLGNKDLALFHARFQYWEGDQWGPWQYDPAR